MTSTQQKGKATATATESPAEASAEMAAAAMPDLPMPAAVGQAPAAGTVTVLPDIVVSQHPASPEAIRLECLKIALTRGMSLRTQDGRVALREAVENYYAIVMGKPFPVPEAADG